MKGFLRVPSYTYGVVMCEDFWKDKCYTDGWMHTTTNPER
jgi:hypothetical protein